MPKMTILAIETSQRKGSIALKKADGEFFYSQLSDEKRHDNELMPAISRLFSEAAITPDNLDVVGISTGPGGFTGLRIAISTAKMLALTLKCQLVAVPSALVVAEAITGKKKILVALSSKKDAFWATLLIVDNSGHWQIDGSPQFSTGENLDLSDVSLIVADKFLPEPFNSKVGEAGIEIVEPTFAAENCLKAAMRKLDAGKISDPDNLLPIYAREPEAVSIWNARKEQAQQIKSV